MFSAWFKGTVGVGSGTAGGPPSNATNEALLKKVPSSTRSAVRCRRPVTDVS